MDKVVELKRELVTYSRAVAGGYSGYWVYYRRLNGGHWEGCDRGQAYALDIASRVYGVKKKDIILTWK